MKQRLFRCCVAWLMGWCAGNAIASDYLIGTYYFPGWTLGAKGFELTVPRGASRDSTKDQSVAKPAQFEAHLLEAKRLMDAYPARTNRMGVICCWNEFGEGSYIEPTKKDGFSYLEKMKKVFGAP